MIYMIVVLIVERDMTFQTISKQPTVLNYTYYAMEGQKQIKFDCTAAQVLYLIYKLHIHSLPSPRLSLSFFFLSLLSRLIIKLTFVFL